MSAVLDVTCKLGVAMATGTGLAECIKTVIMFSLLRSAARTSPRRIEVVILFVVAEIEQSEVLAWIFLHVLGCGNRRPYNADGEIAHDVSSAKSSV